MGVQTQQPEIRISLGGSALFASVFINAFSVSKAKQNVSLMTFEEILMGKNSAQFFEVLKQAVEQAQKKEWIDTIVNGQIPFDSIVQARPKSGYTLIPINADALSEMIDEIKREKHEEEKMLELAKKVLEPFFKMLDEKENLNKSINK